LLSLPHLLLVEVVVVMVMVAELWSWWMRLWM
jgi:hypothetical protein